MNSRVKKAVSGILKTLVLPVVVVLIFGMFTGGRSLNSRMLLTTARQTVLSILISMGLVGNMNLGMWDFSSGAVVLSSAIIGGNLMLMTNTGIWGMLLFCVLVGVVMTSFTGFLNNKLKVPALVLTIALVFVYEALPRVIFPSGVKIRLSMTTLAATPYIFIVLAVLFVVFYLIYTKSTHGHNLKALGGNQDIAKAAGLNSDAIMQKSFTISGLFLGVAGAIYLSQNGQIENVTSLSSVAMVMDAMMGVFLSFFLRKFCDQAVALVIGSFTMTSITNGFVALGMSTTVREVTTGLLLLVLLGISANEGRIAKWKADKKRAEEANRKYQTMERC